MFPDTRGMKGQLMGEFYAPQGSKVVLDTDTDASKHGTRHIGAHWVLGN